MRGADRGGRRAPAGRDRRPDPHPQRAADRSRRDDRRQPVDPDGDHHGRRPRTGRRRCRPRRRRRCSCQGGHRDAPRRRRPVGRAGVGRGHRRRDPTASPGRDLHPSRRRRRARRCLHRPAARPARRGDRRPARPRRARRPRRQLGGRAGPPGRTAVVRPCRHRRVRGVARTGCRRARRRPPPRPLTEGEGVVRQAPGRRLAIVLRAAPPARRRRQCRHGAARVRRRRPPRPVVERRRVDRWPPAADHRHDHHGPADGRLWRRSGAAR